MKVKKKTDKPHYDMPAMERAARISKLPGFKLIIAGSRHFDELRVKKIIREHWDKVVELMGHKPAYILSGACPTGADRAGELLARKLTGQHAITFPANWNLLGKAAGIHRNIDMVTCGHGLLIVWDGKSRGSGHMLGCMEIRGRPVYEIEIS